MDTCFDIILNYSLQTSELKIGTQLFHFEFDPPGHHDTQTIRHAVETAECMPLQLIEYN